MSILGPNMYILCANILGYVHFRC